MIVDVLLKHFEFYENLSIFCIQKYKYSYLKTQVIFR